MVPLVYMSEEAVPGFSAAIRSSMLESGTSFPSWDAHHDATDFIQEKKRKRKTHEVNSVHSKYGAAERYNLKTQMFTNIFIHVYAMYKHYLCVRIHVHGRSWMPLAS